MGHFKPGYFIKKCTKILTLGHISKLMCLGKINLMKDIHGCFFIWKVHLQNIIIETAKVTPVAEVTPVYGIS